MTARKQIEQMYTDTCTILETRDEIDPVSHRMTKEEETTCKGQPCRLSFSSTSANEKGNADTVQQVVKLFLAPEIKVSAGSRIRVSREGRTMDWKRSSLPAIYPTHQEIVLEPFEGYA